MLQKRLFEDLSFGDVTDSDGINQTSVIDVQKLMFAFFVQKNFTECAVWERFASPANGVVYFHNIAANILELLDGWLGTMFVLGSSCIH